MQEKQLHIKSYSVDCRITEVDNLWLQPVPVLFRIEFQNETAVMNIKPKVSYARSFVSTTEEVNTKTVSPRISSAVMVVCFVFFQVSSDLVVVRGHYTVLTLCLYGNMALPPSAAPGYRSPSPLTRRYVSQHSW